MFAALDDGHNLIWFGFPEVRVQELIAAVFGGLENGSTLFLRSVEHPVLKLSSDFEQHITAHQIYLAVRVEEADHALGLLERLINPFTRHTARGL
jgi:hypothetical protein